MLVNHIYTAFMQRMRQRNCNYHYNVTWILHQVLEKGSLPKHVDILASVKWKWSEVIQSVLFIPRIPLPTAQNSLSYDFSGSGHLNWDCNQGQTLDMYDCCPHSPPRLSFQLEWQIVTDLCDQMWFHTWVDCRFLNNVRSLNIFICVYLCNQVKWRQA